jgi:hypothetical protein
VLFINAEVLHLVLFVLAVFVPVGAVVDVVAIVSVFN